MKNIETKKDLKKLVMDEAEKNPQGINIVRTDNINYLEFKISEDLNLKGKKIPKNTKFKLDELGNLSSEGSKGFTNIYKEEMYKTPEQKDYDKVKELKKKIEDSIRKCETYLGEMQQAQIIGDREKFNDAKEAFQGEVKLLKEYEKETREIPPQLTFALVTSINRIHQLENTAQTLQFEQQETVKNAEKSVKDLQRDDYIIHLKALMDMRENLSQQEAMDLSSAVSCIVMKENHDKATINAGVGARRTNNDNPEISDTKDGNNTINDIFDDIDKNDKGEASWMKNMLNADFDDGRTDPYGERTLFDND